MMLRLLSFGINVVSPFFQSYHDGTPCHDLCRTRTGVNVSILYHVTCCTENTQNYFILSSEINAYQKQIKVISIT